MKKTAKILVSGSIVFDTIFDLESAISDQVSIENGIASKQNLMFLAKQKKVYYGGTGGNISYGLGLLGHKPSLFSIVGRDFVEYEKHLKSKGIILKTKKDPAGYSATYYSMTDTKKEQIGIFQGGVYHTHINDVSLADNISVKEIVSYDYAIFSPGTAKSIVKQMYEFRKINKKAVIIFDPGQMIAISFDEKLLEKALKIADIAVWNDVEANYLHNHFKFDLKKIFSIGVKKVVETRGALGSVLFTQVDGEIVETKVEALKVKKVLDPTGAGDAFRAGLIDGLVQGLPFDKAMKMGAKLGAKCVASQGGQTYTI